MRINWVYTIGKSDTAQSVLEKIIRQRENDLKTKAIRKAYTIREFALKLSHKGLALPSSKVSFSYKTVDLIRKAKERPVKIYRMLSNRLGLPYVLKPKWDKKERKIRTAEEILGRIEAIEKRHLREMKELYQMCDEIQDNIADKTLAALDEIKWVYNRGKIRTWAEVVDKLWRWKIEQERDRLFHSRRYERSKEMNHSFNKEIEVAVDMLSWVLIDNPWTHEYYEEPYEPNYNYKSVALGDEFLDEMPEFIQAEIE